jgi:alpha-D-xyloside xylohydrolase
VWDEYPYGGGLLVAPLTEAGASKRDVYLPAGRWMDYNDKRTIYSGGSTITATAPLATIPLFVREGAIIARGDIIKLNNNWDAPWSPKLRIEVFPSAEISHFDNYTGRNVRTITASSSSTGVTVHLEDLGVEGTLEIYCRGVHTVVRNGISLPLRSGFQYDSKQQELSVSFSGATVIDMPGAASSFVSSISSRQLRH